VSLLSGGLVLPAMLPRFIEMMPTNPFSWLIKVDASAASGRADL